MVVSYCAEQGVLHSLNAKIKYNTQHLNVGFNLFESVLTEIGLSAKISTTTQINVFIYIYLNTANITVFHSAVPLDSCLSRYR